VKTFALVVAMSALAGAAPDPRMLTIMVTGSLHGDEVPADVGGDWFALVAEGTGASLHPVQLRLTPEEDMIMMDTAGAKTGRRVEIDPDVESIALLEGPAWITPGPLPTSLVNQAMDAGASVEARVGHGSYHLSVLCRDVVPRIDEYRRQTCGLTLRSEHARQTLFTYSAAFSGRERMWAAEKAPVVLWAGDLDGDGRLDVLLDTSHSSNEQAMRLFLSSTATGGQLVSEVANFSHHGC